MLDRTIACGLATSASPDKNLLTNISTVLSNEPTLLTQIVQKTTNELQTSYPPQFQDAGIQLVQPELDSILLSNFGNYQQMIENKIINATSNIAPQNVNGHQLINNQKPVLIASFDSQHDESNLLNNWNPPFQQDFHMQLQVCQGQFITKIQSNLAKYTIEQQIQRSKEKQIYQKLQLCEGLHSPAKNGVKEFDQVSFTSHVIVEMPMQNNTTDLLSDEEARMQYKLVENVTEKQPQQHQLHVVDIAEPTQYSLNSDNLLGMIQDNMTNTQVRTEAILENQMEFKFDFSEQPENRVEEAQGQNEQFVDHQYGKMQNLETSLAQKSFEENNNNFSLEVNINSESKNNIYYERKEFTTFQATALDVNEDPQKQNYLQQEDSVYQTVVNQKYYESDENIVISNICPAQQQQVDLTVEEYKIFETSVFQFQGEKKLQNLKQQHKSQFSFKAEKQLQNQIQEKIIDSFPTESNLFMCDPLEQIVSSVQEQYNLQQQQCQIALPLEPHLFYCDQNMESEVLNRMVSSKREQNNQKIQYFSETPNENNVQSRTLYQQDIAVIELKSQDGLCQVQAQILSSNLQNQADGLIGNTVLEAPPTTTINSQQNMKPEYRFQQTTILFNHNSQRISKRNQDTDEAKSQSELLSKSIKVSNPKSSISKIKESNQRKMNENEQKQQEPLFRIAKSNYQQGQQMIKTEHFQVIPNTFNNFSNLHPFISININRDNQISLNLFRNYNNQSNFDNRNHEKTWQSTIPMNIAQNFNSISRNVSTEIQAGIKSLETQEKKFQDISVQATNESIDEYMYPVRTQTSQHQNKDNISNRNQNLHLQKETRQIEDELNQSQGESISQKLDKIRIIADYYMVSGSIKQQVHKQFEEALKTHVLIRFSPEPIDDLGRQIFKDGLVMVAMVKMLSRSSKNAFLQSYIFDYLQSAFTIEYNTYLFSEESKKVKAKFENFIVENYAKVFKQHQMKSEKPVQRTCQIKSTANTQRKLTFQTNTITINEKSYVQTRRKQNNIASNSPVEKINVMVEKSQSKKSQSQNQNYHLTTLQKIPANLLGQILEENNSIQYLQQKNKKIEQKVEKCQPQRKVQKVAKIMQTVQTESSLNSLQQIQEKNTKQNHLYISNEFHSVQSPKQETSSKAQKANNSKYADLKMNSLEKNECIKQVEACIQNRNNKFNQLYEKYKKIREDKRNQVYFPPSIPAEDKIVSITKSALMQSKEKDEKKKNKHVQFLITDPVQVRKEDVEVEGQDDGLKPKKRKKSKK